MLTETVNPQLVVTTTALASNNNPSLLGQSVTFTATVTPATGTAIPTGTVTFKDGTATLGTVLLAGGTTTFSISTLAIGTHSITAVYNGDSGFNGSTSQVLTETVNPQLVVTTTALASNNNPSLLGQSVTFTATVTPATGTANPTGTVTFKDGTATLGTGASRVALPPSASVRWQSVRSITAVYNGDSGFNGSTSQVLTETVGPQLVVTTTALASNNNPSLLGQSVTFTATVTPATGTANPTGTVTFKDGTATLGTWRCGWHYHLQHQYAGNRYAPSPPSITATAVSMVVPRRC